MQKIKKMRGTEGKLDYFVVAEKNGISLGIKPMFSPDGLALRIRSMKIKDKTKDVTGMSKKHVLDGVWEGIEFAEKNDTRCSTIINMKLSTPPDFIMSAKNAIKFLRHCEEIPKLVDVVYKKVEGHVVADKETIIEAIRKYLITLLKPAAILEEKHNNPEPTKEEKKSKKAKEKGEPCKVIQLFPKK